MYNFGVATAHANCIDFGDLEALDAQSAYTVAFDFYLNTTGAADWFISKRAAAGGYWQIGIDATQHITVTHNDGTSTDAVATGAITTATYYSIMCAWDGSNAHIYYNGVLDSSPAQAKTPSLNAGGVSLGAIHDLGPAAGAACRLGNVMFFNAALSVTDAVMITMGRIPKGGNLKFWAPGWRDPGFEIVGQATAVKAGTVTISEDFRKNAPCFLRHQAQIYTLNSVYKVLSETLGLDDSGTSHVRFDYRPVSDGTLGLAEDPDTFFTRVHLGTDSLGLRDGDTPGTEKFDPAGIIQETLSDGTVWTKLFPPFHRKTKWTSS